MSAPAEPNVPGWLRGLRAADGAIQRVEVAVCVLSLAVMILLAFAQVFLRQFRGLELGPLVVPAPVAWFDNIARHLVIWVGLLGASLATAEGRHIAIEAAPKLFGVRGRRRIEVVTHLAALAITGVLLALCVIYMLRLQVPNEAHLFDVQAIDLKVYRWPLLLVVPLGLALMCWRFGLRILEALVLDDASYQALREDKELEGLEARQEQQEVDLLLESSRLASQAEGAPALDRESARAERARALGSGRASAGSSAASGSAAGAAPAAAAGAPAAAGAAAARPPQERERGGSALRSTDEIPVYRELADDEDLLEPELRRGAALIDSSEELDPASGVEDLAREADEAEEAVDAVADTERLRLDREVVEDPEALEARATTQRLARGDLPGEERARVVIVVRRSGGDA